MSLKPTLTEESDDKVQGSVDTIFTTGLPFPAPEALSFTALRESESVLALLPERN